ncbi:type II toxin-antitoxin system antitoxin SocA domain-containing protein [Paraflavisolibacter sp. H34]|uniref:Panacea domain-containing protein n=1 Tax=Huijunlia imazamoxiresistens TaxID=3127457 RepID=UPI003017D616
MPYPATIIALAFVKKGIDTGKFVTQMKLQKMVYFAHGYHLAKYGSSLIVEEFEAWKFGPVVPSIYQAYKFYGSKPITNLEYVDLSSIALYTLDSRANDAIDYTWKVTENITAEALSNWTHQPRSPWYQVYNPIVPTNSISNLSIESYFRALLTKDDASRTTEDPLSSPSAPGYTTTRS